VSLPPFAIESSEWVGTLAQTRAEVTKALIEYHKLWRGLLRRWPEGEMMARAAAAVTFCIDEGSD
jgi:hypothetical protein